MITKQLSREFRFVSPADAGELLRRLLDDLENHAHLFLRITYITAAYTVDPFDEMIAVDTTGAVTVTLPTARDAGEGKMYVVKDQKGTGAVANNITISPSGSDTIDLAGSNTIILNRDVRWLVSDGTSNYMVI